jgi:hypothetical protein
MGRNGESREKGDAVLVRWALYRGVSNGRCIFTKGYGLQAPTLILIYLY